MKLGRDVSRHDVLDNWRNTHRYELVIAIIWLFWMISETDPGLWDRLQTIPNHPTRKPDAHPPRQGLFIFSK